MIQGTNPSLLFPWQNSRNWMQVFFTLWAPTLQHAILYNQKCTTKFSLMNEKRASYFFLFTSFQWNTNIALWFSIYEIASQLNATEKTQGKKRHVHLLANKLWFHKKSHGYRKHKKSKLIGPYDALCIITIVLKHNNISF
jgi:hypothetical protein